MEETLVKDARLALWVLVVINLIVLFFFLADGFNNEIVIAGLVSQGIIFVFWLVPIFLYQVLGKRLSLKVAMYKALASYRNAMDQVQW
ncbi:hypothetical protein AWR36_015930 [Microbulbifer flavimaris]|uniref:Uncharacterized protein n=1 Tax=Microbulbifer flavimaris TaxID=1781068 RepID=A0ABX4HVD8_9GAMM|nr:MULTISPECIES: hypothetical protein [Microbulbifer]KUJ78458.1 hypothetical protein AVO43_15870 [Microbulbifer sp. ZGT114]PCO04051.1 hypothetical protein AWR36_015930 [Microbulbifer flavimaris]